MKTLNNVFPLAFEGKGIFSEMTTAPWYIDFNSNDLDIQFFSDYGNKVTTPLVNHYIIDDVVSDINRQKIASIVLSRFNTSWSKKYATLSADYNPIQNYNMTETENVDNTGNNTDIVDSTIGDDYSENATNGKTDTISSTITADTVNNTYGFNSETAVPSDTGTGTNTTNSTDTVSETIDSTKSNDRTENTTNTHSIDENEQRTLNRSGNIGVTTSQQMLKSEIELWKWNYITDVFKDVAHMLTLPIYVYDDELIEEVY